MNISVFFFFGSVCATETNAAKCWIVPPSDLLCSRLHYVEILLWNISSSAALIYLT